MRTVVVNNHVLKVYNSVDELPIVNFQKYNKYLLIDAGIGSDVDDIDKRIVTLANLIGADPKKAQQELLNMRQAIFMVASEISPRHLAFAALIHSIDGRQVTDLSDESLQDILEKLKKVKRYWLIDLLTELKKKLDSELEVFFPQNDVNSHEKEAFDQIKKRTLEILRGILTGHRDTKVISEIDKYLLGIYKPKSFVGSESVEVQYEKQFESACLFISQKTGLNPKEMTVLQFYNALEQIRIQSENESKSLKLHKHGR